jgi:SAM-dependent methyltransferase
MVENFPPEFDPAFYRATYSDLNLHSDQDLLLHYETYGRREGRCASPAVSRKNFLSFIADYENALEIGPFNRPLLSGPKVKYFDVLGAEELKTRAINIGESPEKVPNIHFVCKSGRLKEVSAGFDVVVSSHCIEHQPDLVRHLCEVERLLCSGGCYCLIIPDCRYCFDHFLEPSNIAEILDAHYQKREQHTLASVIEHRALTCHNVPQRHWVDDSGAPNLSAETLKTAIQEWEDARGQYIDVHAWQFTPRSFRQILSLLNELKFTTLAAARVYDTPFGNCEFCAVLHKN